MSTHNDDPRPSNLPLGSRPILVLGLVVLLTGLAYAQTLHNEFVYDDRYLIAQNKLFQRLDAIPRLFVTDWWKGLEGQIKRSSPSGDQRYRPLAATTYVLNYAIAGPAPWGYHLVNLILHAGVSFLLYLLAISLGWAAGAAVLAAALYAVHPLHSEAVAWVVGRPELLMSLGVLGSLWCAARGYHRSALAAFSLGLFSKEQAVVVPVLLLLMDFCRGGVFEPALTWGHLLRAGLKRYAGYIAVLAAYLVLRTVVMGGVRPPAYPFLVDPLEYTQGSVWALTVLKLAGQYLWLSVWPATLSVDYSYNAIPMATAPWEPDVLWAGGVWGGLLALGAWAWRWDRRITFAIGMTVVTFMPVANVLIPVGTPLAERLFYLPLGGLCLLAGLAYERASRTAERTTANDERGPTGGNVRGFRVCLPRSVFTKFSTSTVDRRTVLRIVIVLICVALTLRTVVRVQDWRNNEALLSSAISAVPGNARVHVGLGYELRLKGTDSYMKQALEHFQTAVSLYPDYMNEDPEFSAFLGDALFSLGRRNEGMAALERAFRLERSWGLYLGLAYARTNQPEKAEQIWRESLRDVPNDPDIRSNLSRLLIERGQYAQGLAEADEVLIRRPDFVEAVFNRALALEAMERLEEAAASYQRVLTLQDSPPPARQDAETRLKAIRALLGLSVPSSRDCVPGMVGC